MSEPLDAGAIVICTQCRRPVRLIDEKDQCTPFWFVGQAGSAAFEQKRAPDTTRAEWLGVLIDDEKWLAPKKIASAREAALFLCGSHPLTRDGDDGRPVVDGSMQDRFQSLWLGHFDKIERSDLSARRSIIEWWSLAVSDDLERHPEIDELVRRYIATHPETEPKPPNEFVPSAGDAPNAGSSEMEEGPTKPRRWSDDELRVLRAESREGSTQAELAQKYGVAPQRISVLLKRAKERFEKKAASPFPHAPAVRRPGKKSRNG